MATQNVDIGARVAAGLDFPPGGGQDPMHYKQFERSAYPNGVLLPGQNVKFVFGVPANTELDIFWFKIKIGGGAWQNVTFDSGAETSWHFDSVGSMSTARWKETDAVAGLAGQVNPLPFYIMGSYGAADGFVMPFNIILVPGADANYPSVGNDRVQRGDTQFADTSTVTDVPIAGSALEAGTTFKAYGPIMIIADVDDTPVYLNVPDAFGNMRDISLADLTTMSLGDSRDGSVFHAANGRTVTERLFRENLPSCPISRGGSTAAAFLLLMDEPLYQYVISKHRRGRIAYGINAHAGTGENAALGDTIHGHTLAIAAKIRAQSAPYANPNCEIILATVYPNTAGSTAENTFSATYNYLGWARQNELIRSCTPLLCPGLCYVMDEEAATGNGLGGYNLACVPASLGGMPGDGIHCSDPANLIRCGCWDIYTIYGRQPVVGPQIIAIWCNADGRRVYLCISGVQTRQPNGSGYVPALGLVRQTNQAGLTLAAQGGIEVDEAYVHPVSGVLIGFPKRRILQDVVFPPDNIAVSVDPGSSLKVGDKVIEYLPNAQTRVENGSTQTAAPGGADTTPPALNAPSSYVAESGRYIYLETDEATNLPLSPESLDLSQRRKVRLRADGNLRSLLRATRVSDSAVLLVTTNPLGAGKVPTVEYLGGGGIEDALGNEMLSFPEEEVDNLSMVADGGDESQGLVRLMKSPFIGSPFTGGT
jgi:hypothetical protein